MIDRNACLMANHGLVAGGPTLAQAMKVLQEVESLCEVYLKALAMARNVAHQDGKTIAKFTTAVFDLIPLDDDFGTLSDF